MVRTPCRPLRMWSRCGVSTGWGGASGPLPANGAAVPAAGRVRRHLLAICLKGSGSVLMDGSGFSHGQRKRFSHCVSLLRSAATGGLGLWSLNIHGQLVATPWLGHRVAQAEGASRLGVCLEDTGGVVIAHHRRRQTADQHRGAPRPHDQAADMGDGGHSGCLHRAGVQIGEAGGGRHGGGGFLDCADVGWLRSRRDLRDGIDHTALLRPPLSTCHASSHPTSKR